MLILLTNVKYTTKVQFTINLTNVYSTKKEVVEIAHLKVLDICGRLSCFIAVTRANSNDNECFSVLGGAYGACCR